MTKPFSLAYKKKMVERMTGTDAVSARALSRETGVTQTTLSRWRFEARSLPVMAPRKRETKGWPVAEKIRILAEARDLTGRELAAYLEREGVLLVQLEQWGLALEEEGVAPKAVAKRIRALELELARKEKALAEAAALLVLKKNWSTSWRTRTTTRTRRTSLDSRNHRRSAGIRCSLACRLRPCRAVRSNRRKMAEDAGR